MSPTTKSPTPRPIKKCTSDCPYLGDVNCDGYDDVVVGASHYDNVQNNEGTAYVYYGSASGLPTAASWQFEPNTPDAYFGRAVASAGDVNGDGCDDVIIGSYVHGGFGDLLSLRQWG